MHPGPLVFAPFSKKTAILPQKHHFQAQTGGFTPFRSRSEAERYNSKRPPACRVEVKDEDGKRRPLFYFAMDVWGERTRLACGFGRRARNIVGQISWLTGFRRDAENGNRDGRAPHSEFRRRRREESLTEELKPGLK